MGGKSSSRLGNARLIYLATDLVATYDYGFGLTILDKTRLENMMSGSRHSEPKITNETTIWRRAWIDNAVESVRARLSPAAEFDQDIADDVSAKPVSASKRPSLYVAWSRSKSAGK